MVFATLTVLTLIFPSQNNAIYFTLHLLDSKNNSVVSS